MDVGVGVNRGDMKEKNMVCKRLTITELGKKEVMTKAGDSES